MRSRVQDLQGETLCAGRETPSVREVLPVRGILACVFVLVAIGTLLVPSPASADFGFLARYIGARGPAAGQFTKADYRPAIAVDSAGFVYAADPGNGRIEKFTSALEHVGSFETKTPSTAKSRTRPIRIAIGPGDVLYVLDVGAYRAVVKFDTNGQFLGDMVQNAASYDGRPADVDHPHGLAVDRAGNVFVLDSHHGRVVRFDSDGHRLGSFGSFGSGDGRFTPYAPVSYPVDGPSAITIDSDGNVLVVDTYGGKIEKFTATGQFLTRWSPYGGKDPEFRDPKQIAAAPDGTVWVTDNDRVQQFAADGRFLGRLGVDRTFAFGQSNPLLDGEFNFLSGIAFDPQGSLFAIDQPIENGIGARIQKFGVGGVRAPGTVLPAAPTVTNTLTLMPAPKSGLCPVRLRSNGPRWRDCSLLRTAEVQWSVRCPPGGGVAGWAVALRVTPTVPIDGDFSYQPLRWTGPEFPTGGPSQAPNGTWLLPNGTDVGRADPRKTNVLSYAGTSAGESTGRRAVFVGPGERLYSTMIGVCSYRVASGKVETVETSADSPVRITPPAIQRSALTNSHRKRLDPSRLKPHRRFSLSVTLAYDSRALPGGSGIDRVYVRGAGIRRVQESWDLTLTPKRCGTIRVWGTINGQPTNTLKLSVCQPHKRKPRRARAA